MSTEDIIFTVIMAIALAVLAIALVATHYHFKRERREIDRTYAIKTRDLAIETCSISEDACQFAYGHSTAIDAYLDWGRRMQVDEDVMREVWPEAFEEQETA